MTKPFAELSLPLHALEPDGDFDGTQPAHTRLSSHLLINGQHFHLEAVEVKPIVEGFLEATNPALQDDVDHLFELLGDHPESTQINGRNYVIYLMPYAV